MPYKNRLEAGRALARRLRHTDLRDTIVIGLARGGIPVAAEVAQRLELPLDTIVVKKVTVPWYPEVALGALAEGGGRVIEPDSVDDVGVIPADLEEAERRARVALRSSVATVRSERPPRSMKGRTVILVDDGMATGATMAAACAAVRGRGASRVIVAVPVAAPHAAHRLRAIADAVIALETPQTFHSVGQYYVDFPQVSDTEVLMDLQGPS